MFVVLSLHAQWHAITKLNARTQPDRLFKGKTRGQLALEMIDGSHTRVLVLLFTGDNKAYQRRETGKLDIRMGGYYGILAAILHGNARWWQPTAAPRFRIGEQALTAEPGRSKLMFEKDRARCHVHTVEFTVLGTPLTA